MNAMENYFWNTTEKTNHNIYVLVIYDIVENKRRTAFAKKLCAYGFRVQKSAFEALISKEKYNKMMKEIPGMINPAEDSVRVYRMTGFGEVSLFGVNEKLQNEEVVIL